jgi:hypothetical protein
MSHRMEYDRPRLCAQIVLRAVFRATILRKQVRMDIKWGSFGGSAWDTPKYSPTIQMV